MNAATAPTAVSTIRPPVRPGAPTPEQRAAVADFRERNGRSWKEKLSTCWATGKYGSADQSALLQQVRNQLGPQWLDKVASRDLEIKPIPELIDNEITRIRTLPETGDAFSLLHDIREQVVAGETLIDIRKDFDQVSDGSNHDKSQHETGMREISRFLRALEDEVYLLHDLNALAKNAALISAHDAAARKSLPAVSQHQSIYVISVNREEWNQAALEKQTPVATIPVVDHLAVNEVVFANVARNKGISQISSPSLDAPYIWYTSPLPKNSQANFAHRNALHVHSIDGREPSAIDYQNIADKLDIPLVKRLDAEAANEVTLSM